MAHQNGMGTPPRTGGDPGGLAFVAVALLTLSAYLCSPHTPSRFFNGLSCYTRTGTRVGAFARSLLWSSESVVLDRPATDG